MKILLLSDPGNIHTIKWATSLAKEGIDVLIFGLSNYEKDTYLSFKNINVITIEYTNKLKNRVNDGAFNKVKYLKVLPKLKKAVKSFQPDILHAHYASSYGLLGAIIDFHPFVISVWGSDVFDFPRVSRLHKLIFKYNLSKADKILSTSHIMAKETSKYTNKLVEITPFGIDTNLFRKKNCKKENEEIIIGTVKTLTEKYGISYLLKAFQILSLKFPKEKLRLRIVGDGEDRKKLQGLARQLKIDEKVEFVGKIKNTEVPNALNSFSIYVALSNSESFGVAVLEASACELPVVVSDVGGLPEVVEDGKTGIIVPAKNYEIAAAAIEKLIRNSSLRKTMGTKGREKVLHEYSWDVSIEIMLKIYKEVYKTTKP